jgi:hypothetical protein
LKSGANSICSDDSTKYVTNCDIYLTDRDENADNKKVQDESNLSIENNLVKAENYFTDFYTCKFCK